jgi:hypothetical protein
MSVAAVKIEDTKVAQILQVRGNGLLRLRIERHGEPDFYSLHPGKKNRSSFPRSVLCPQALYQGTLSRAVKVGHEVGF